MKFDSVDSIIDFAVRKEEEAAEFYTKLASIAKHRHMQEAFLGFAAEENGHRAKLLKIKAGHQLLSAESKILDLKIGETVSETPISPDLTYQQALIVAMKAEKAAFALYHRLAEATDNPGLKETLMGLAQEEAKHKLRFEIEYDEQILLEN